MVHTGWKNPGHFKFTPKAGISAQEQAVSGVLATSNSDNASGDSRTEERANKGEAEKAAKDKPFALSKVHGGLSKVCELLVDFLYVIHGNYTQ